MEENCVLLQVTYGREETAFLPLPAKHVYEAMLILECGEEILRQCRHKGTIKI